jgi:hypothetical protein
LDLTLATAAIRRPARTVAVCVALGGNHGLWALRVPFEHLGERIFPDMFSLATADRAFADGELVDPALRARFEKNVLAFLSLPEPAKHYPCMKRAWVEFLGDPPLPRVTALLSAPRSMQAAPPRHRAVDLHRAPRDESASAWTEN